MKLVRESLADIFKPKTDEEIIKEINLMSQEEKDEHLIKYASKGNAKVVKFLLDAGAYVDAKDEYNVTALMNPSYYGYENIVQILLNAGADVNVKNSNGWTALKYALEFNPKGVVQLLKKYGAKE